MSLQTCWRCLSKASDPSLNTRHSISQQWTLLPASTASFSTSLPLLALPPKKKGPVMQNGRFDRGVKKTFTKKKDALQKVDRSRKPAIGERKALRKRIVLSNTNALEVQDLQDVTAASTTDESLRGHVLGIPGPVVDQLRAVEAFKVAQGWPLFRRPAMLMREETIQLGKEMDEIQHLSEEGGEKKKKSIRRVLVGERGSGKTLMLLQAMTMAFLKDWVVINIPEENLERLTPSLPPSQLKTSSSPPPNTPPSPPPPPPLYHQKTYLAHLLASISRANPILQSVKISPQGPSSPGIPIPLPPSLTLSRLCTLGASDPSISHQIFNLLLSELLLPGRPPLLLCLDGLAHTMRDSNYRSSNYESIHAHDLHIIRFFLDHLSGKKGELTNGGVVLAATSGSNSPMVPSLQLALGQLEGRREVTRDPFKKYDERVLGVFEGRKESSSEEEAAEEDEKGEKDDNKIQVQRLGGLSREEARALMEHWAKSGLCRQKVDQGFVGEKWTLSGGGCVGELERAVVRMRV